MLETFCVENRVSESEPDRNSRLFSSLATIIFNSINEKARCRGLELFCTVPRLDALLIDKVTAPNRTPSPWSRPAGTPGLRLGER